ncbi:hypothetical protein [Halomonas sp. M20]|uniref:hypothetical protein n=1 Tax=Halomonas sp. M20 TaxID=2763264 RepID=UPI001D0B20B5|nr:hypothetical protein [Halomonas sp. M20]
MKQLKGLLVILTAGGLGSVTASASAQSFLNQTWEREGIVQEVDLGGQVLISDSLFNVPLDSKLYRRDGKSMRIGDLRVGDRVRYVSQGAPQTLISLQRLDQKVAQ